MLVEFRVTRELPAACKYSHSDLFPRNVELFGIQGVAA
jgi:hypothetical protein